MTHQDRRASAALFSACLLAWAPLATIAAPVRQARPTPSVHKVVPAPRGAPTPPARPTPPPPVTVLLVGDSLMATAFGQQLEVTLKAFQGLRVHRLARSATGLARPDHHDWLSKATAATKRHAPDFVVVLLGSNDGQDLVPLPGMTRRQRAVHWGDPGWPAAYRERVLGLLGALGAPDRPVLWLGLPPMRSHSLEKKLAMVRKEQRAAVLSMGAAHQYVGLFALVRELRDRTPAKAKKTLFTPDGVHFSLKGAVRFMPLLRPLLSPWVARATVLSQLRALAPR